MTIRYHHSKCQPLGLRVAEAKCLRYIGRHHPDAQKARRVFGNIITALQTAGLVRSQQSNRLDSYLRLTREGAATLRKLNALHGAP